MPASFVGMDPAPQAVQIERPAMGAKRAVGQSSQGESGSGLLVPETQAMHAELCCPSRVRVPVEAFTVIEPAAHCSHVVWPAVGA